MTTDVRAWAPPRLRRAGLRVTCALGLLCGACHDSRPLPDPSTPPLILLVTIDALRADALGVYGYDRPTSPQIDAFAREAIVVSDAMAQSHYTKASIGSLLTGLFPLAHKAITTVAFRPRARPAGEPGAAQADLLVAELVTLPEALRDAGYNTSAFMTNPVLAPGTGYEQGFDTYRYFPSAISEPATNVVREVLAALDAKPASRRFIWVHLMEPHHPYEPPEPYLSMFPPRTPPKRHDPRLGQMVRGVSYDVNVYKARYDGEVRAADTSVGTLFAGLKQRGLWDRAVIVLTADHGEQFLEHDDLGHKPVLWDELLHVPLIMKVPGMPPARVRVQAQLVDVFPTLARLGGASVPPSIHGVDLLPILAGKRQADPYAFAQIEGARFAVRTLDWKYIASMQGGKQLFHLAKDPGEQHNLAAQETARAEEMERVLARIVAMSIKAGERIKGRSVNVHPIVLERLRALGYVSGR